MSTRMTSFIFPPAASTRCLILVKVSLAWLYVEPSPSTPPLPSPAVMPATKNWLPWTRQFDQVPGAGSGSLGLVTRCIFMASLSLRRLGLAECTLEAGQRAHDGPPLHGQR